MPDPSAEVEPPFHNRLADHFHDCLAAQTEWSHAVNLLGQRDVQILPLSQPCQQRLCRDGTVVLSDGAAWEFGQKLATMGRGETASLGALFLVGRRPATDGQSERVYCAPLLEVPISVERDVATASLRVTPEDEEYTVNHALVSELIAHGSDDLQDRLADLGELVPDFPTEVSEFVDFWNGFRAVATGLPIVDELPRGSGDATSGGSFELVDFQMPSRPRDDNFRLLPALAMVHGQRTRSALSVLAELKRVRELAPS